MILRKFVKKVVEMYTFFIVKVFFIYAFPECGVLGFECGIEIVYQKYLGFTRWTVGVHSSTIYL